MKEVEPDNHWDEGPEASNLEPMLLSTGPSDAELLTITLLARLYDVQMALLTIASPATADKIFDAHEAGENFNPPMYIPDLKDVDEPTG